MTNVLGDCIGARLVEHISHRELEEMDRLCALEEAEARAALSGTSSHSSPKHAQAADGAGERLLDAATVVVPQGMNMGMGMIMGMSMNMGMGMGPGSVVAMGPGQVVVTGPRPLQGTVLGQTAIEMGDRDHNRDGQKGRRAELHDDVPLAVLVGGSRSAIDRQTNL